jgi:FkbM family methyltransferase
MHKHHEVLYSYADYLINVDIQSIEISESGIIVKTKETGIRLLVDREDKRIAPVEILNFGACEPEELGMVRTLIQSTYRHGYTLYDIGANIGYHSLWILNYFKDINIHAFEPIPKTYGYLMNNLALNNVSNIATYNFGLSDKDTTFDFYCYKGGSVNASMANVSDSKDVERVTCSVTTLDNFTDKEGVERVDFIKCDVEGAEKFVVLGGLKTINRDKPIIFLEILRKWSAKFNYHPNEILTILANAGYLCYVITNGKLEKFTKVDENTLATNYFFVHEDKHTIEILDLIQ